MNDVINICCALNIFTGNQNPFSAAHPCEQRPTQINVWSMPAEENTSTRHSSKSSCLSGEADWRLRLLRIWLTELNFDTELWNSFTQHSEWGVCQLLLAPTDDYQSIGLRCKSGSKQTLVLASRSHSRSVLWPNKTNLKPTDVWGMPHLGWTVERDSTNKFDISPSSRDTVLGEDLEREPCWRPQLQRMCP